ncbi:cleavage and polyadenylation specificity factor subunit 7 isoform X2 [Latimeria chalumnae]|uniref:cleavage and polyadenylation specificity factor subunit 7 isoform X2 n=1 Tax=Latimeria chalumnae TaxID=7897 RepID=UPI0006D8FED0|nr:PREDICTED: cleavage and polyadenylation specificity factor subunit 7 [Latimeria chalumnae]|eukprot:XP_014349653.1 PREDICTED: cleavage and polyadenylation specificity factor subunit 7 [Latimeria chalumnae]
MSEGTDLIDIYAEEEFNQESDFGAAEQVDLYDDVLTGTVNTEKEGTEGSLANQLEEESKSDSKPAIVYTYSGLRNKRAAVCMGNFPWWTTDQDLTNTIKNVGVTDILEIKFAENRANGQSKGYAEVVVASENSVHRLLLLLPGIKVHGDKLEVLLATRENLNHFESQSLKRIPPRNHSRDSSDSTETASNENTTFFPRTDKPPLVQPYYKRPPYGEIPQGPPPPGLPPPPPIPPHSTLGFRGPPPLPSLHYTHMILPPLGLPPHLTVPPPASMPPALHLNPAFFPPPNSSVPPPLDPFRRLSSTCSINRNSELPTPPVPALSETEFDEIMNRNRAIFSSAISNAVSGASSGEYGDATETLLTAIAVIKESKVASDERCKVLISSLRDCLDGIETKSCGSSSRKRHRSRERSHESSRRHRERSHSEDRHDDYYRDRYRDKERDRHR